MKNYTIVYTELRNIDVKAKDEDEARELFLSGEVDYDKSTCHFCEVDEIYESKED